MRHREWVLEQDKTDATIGEIAHDVTAVRFKNGELTLVQDGKLIYLSPKQVKKLRKLIESA